jgi:hypothetical protein
MSEFFALCVSAVIFGAAEFEPRRFEIAAVLSEGTDTRQ